MLTSAIRIATLYFAGTLLTSSAQLSLPPLPSDLPVPQPPTNAVRRVTPAIPAPRRITLPHFPRIGTSNVAPRPYQPLTLSDDILRWDNVNKEHHAQLGETNANFSFSVTNVSTTNVTINWVRPSCGCTLAKLPPTPWTLKPGEGGTIELSIDLRGKYGTLTKYTSVDTSHGQKFLTFKVHIPQQPIATHPQLDTRTRNMQLAMVDRQVVFRGDCAKCHATPAIGKVKGEEIYSAACAICHDTPNRATMVPDLKSLANATGKEYWNFWITHGKPGTLMPAFAKNQGGPLTEEQINTLADFLLERFPRANAAPKASASAGAASNLPNSGTARN